MKNTLKRVMCIVLCIAVIAVMPLSAAAANLAPTVLTADGAKPVVVINGWQNNALYTNPESKFATKAFPPETNDFLTLATVIENYVKMGEGYFEEVTAEINQFLTKDFAPIVCNKDGSPQTNVGVMKLDKSLEYYKNNELIMGEYVGDLGKICADAAGYDRVYVFTYDWRLSPLNLARELNEFIEETVLPETGEDKVNILAEGMGGNVASAYMDKYQKPLNFRSVDNYVQINSTAQGMSLIGALFTGAIDLDPNAFIRYMNDLPDNAPAALASWITMVVLNHEWEINHMAATIDNYIAHQKHRLYDGCIRELINCNAGLWALIPWTQDDDTYEEAKKFMYTDSNGNEYHMNEQLEADIDNYHEVQRNAGATLQKAQKAGVKVAVVSGYNMQALPLYDGLDTNKGASENSDGIVDTKYSSYGATCAYLNNDWVGKHLDEQKIDDGHKHTNAHHSDIHKITIDASTCVLPESTWLIKGLKNDYIHADKDDAAAFIRFLVFADEQRTVRDDGYFPQFMRYDRFNDILYANSHNEARRFNKYGDVNLDGQINSADARVALRAALKLVTLTGTALKNADVDGDGKVTTKDARIILRYALKLEDEFPAEKKK